MKLAASLATLVLGVCLASCMTSSYGVDTIRPHYDGSVIERTHGNYLPGFNICNSVELNLQRSTSKDGAQDYALVVEYTAYDRDFLFIEGGESLAMTVDGERLGFTSPTGSSDYRRLGMTEEFHRNGDAEERAIYPVDAEQLRRIASAKDVRLEIQGEKKSKTWTFSKQNFEHFKKFVAEFVPVGSPSIH